MSHRTRLARLEQRRLPVSAPFVLTLPKALSCRVAEAKARGSFPHSLTDVDLLAVLEAADNARNVR